MMKQKEQKLNTCMLRKKFQSHRDACYNPNIYHGHNLSSLTIIYTKVELIKKTKQLHLSTTTSK